MRTLEYQGMKIEIDEQGYLKNIDDWNENIAELIAAREGVGELTADRRDMIRFMRNYYREHHFFPIVRSICKKAHQPKECFTEKFIDPVKAWKIAGLPNPGDEVEMFKSWEPLGF